ncbi:N-acetylglucosamine-specific PTS transporter subunit IIBC [Ruminococcaceae bacterium OttesenSCG-928-A16]|nr:N-acetylglucosamine-specific PTS transporter subunit IIBC [Ruminococcaceae bacterium OttesenSCG-928-A16]
MMKYLQRLGKSLMLPVATLPVASILMGIGYWIDHEGWGANNVIAAFLIKSGGALIDNMGILFAIGVAVGMAVDNDGTAALAGLVSMLMVKSLLAPGTVAMFLKITVEEVNPAFVKISDGNQFIGILCGLIGAACYNRFRNTKLPTALAFFSGKRSVAIVTAGFSIVAAVILFFAWPVIYSGLVWVGEVIMGFGAVGAGVYAFLNRLLIPLGLHHALNSVFWFGVAEINDIGKFWGTIPGGIYGTTGMYMTGFFPVMMFGLPAASLAMYHCAKPSRKKETGSLMGSSALSSFFTGITEPLEFSFMFLSPALYVIHAALTGIVTGICAALPVRSGFNFSAGLVDWILSFMAPMAQNPLFIIPIGLVVAVVYYVIFRFAITKFNLKTPGREDEETSDEEKAATLASNDYAAVAALIIEGLGGVANIASVDNCITRLRTEVKNYADVNEKKIRSAGVAGIIRPSKTSVQVVVGTQVQFVADEVKRQMKE